MKILIVAGGTGGHLYPGLALAKALVGHDVSFVVRRGDLGHEIIAREGFPVERIAGAGLPRSLSLAMILFPFKFVWGTWQGIVLLLKNRPDWIVGMGGYLSVPLVTLGCLFRIKTMIHEQNVHPGMANRFLGHFADSIALSFKESEIYFPRGRTWVAGLPIRSDIGQIDQITGRRAFGLALEMKTVLVFGGSLGAVRLNSIIVEAWKILLEKGESFQVLHITGKNDFERVQDLYGPLKINAKVLPFCHDMASAYAASDIVICRSGASTLCELMVVKRWAVLVPYPYATNDHQVLNANVYVQAGLGEIILEKDLTPAAVATSLMRAHAYIQNKSVPEMSSGAAGRLAHYLTTHAA